MSETLTGAAQVCRINGCHYGKAVEVCAELRAQVAALERDLKINRDNAAYLGRQLVEQTEALEKDKAALSGALGELKPWFEHPAEESPRQARMLDMIRAALAAHGTPGDGT